jgi:MoaA/NifB/PqqE/SkfB family radical SAM enzyme
MCVANCVMCNVTGHFKRPLVPFPEVVETLFEVSASGVGKIDLFGGEITLRRDVFRVVSTARDLLMDPMFITTGYFLTAAYVRRLADAGLAGCNVSLDAATPDIHDRIRGCPGLFRRSLRALKALARQDRVRTSVGTVVLPENLDDLVRLVDLSGRLGFKDHFFFLCVSGPFVSSTPRWLTREDAARFVGGILPAMEAAAARHGMTLHLKPELRSSALPREAWIEPLSRGEYNLRFTGNDDRCRSPGFHPFVAVDRTVFACQAPSGISRDGGLGRMGPDRSLLEVLSGEALAAVRRDAGHFPYCRQCIDPDEVR